MSAPDDLTEKLRTLVRIPTVSYDDPTAVDTEAFDLFVATLAELFPRLHDHLALTRVERHGLLFHWPGASAERPVVLMAHLDVVPVDESAPWQHPAFDAVVADGAVWGRGTLDDKGSLVAICEAVERLLARRVRSRAGRVAVVRRRRGGVRAGARRPRSSELTARGVRPWFVLDEGGAVAADAFPGVAAPLAVVGVTEKGTTNLELRTEGRGGHSSMPSRMDTDRPAGAGHPAAREQPVPRARARAHAGDAAPGRAARPGRAAPADRPRPPGARRCSPARCVAAGPETAAMTRTTATVTTSAGVAGATT